MLRQFLAVGHLQKRVLFASICDPNAVNQLQDHTVGERAVFNLGMNADVHSESVALKGTIIAKGPLMGNLWSGRQRVWGQTVTVRLESCPSMSWYRTMGPAISWGKKEMYKSSFQKLFCICPGFQYTSRT